MRQAVDTQIRASGGHPARESRQAGWRWRRVAVASLMAAAVGAFAGAGGAQTSGSTAFVPPELLRAAQSRPDDAFGVIVQGAATVTSDGVTEAIKATRDVSPGRAKGVTRKYELIDADAAEVTGRQLLMLANDPAISAVTGDDPVKLTGYSNKQKWPDAAQVSASWLKALKGWLHPPRIAVVDSGIDPSHPDLKGRVVKQQTFTSLSPNSPGDGRGHGTFVAGIAAGADSGFAGAIPNAELVSVDVLNDAGEGVTSDVIAACEWIFKNKDSLDIGVVNLSLSSTTRSTFVYDPLDKAVEKLWLNGVVVVAAAGNYAQSGQASGVLYAPANDPFVITVGASDTKGDATPANDAAAPWSSYGYTADGFWKPEIGAPGRYLNGPVPAQSTMLAQAPERQVSNGYMWMSGTSFAAPVVAGAAAYVLAVHPWWTPDQVKGALMLRTAVPAGYSVPGALGVGVLQADYAAFLADGSANPNIALDKYVKTDAASGARVFDSASWSSAAKTDASWSSASWSSASWSSASWSSASWSSASWSSASWSSLTWSAASWSSASWSSATWELLGWVE